MEDVRHNRLRYAGAFLLALVGWALVLLGGHLAQHPPPPRVETPRLALWPRIGINLPPAALDSTALLQQLAQAHVRWVRVEIPWAELEPRPGDFRWEPWDVRWRRLQALGITPVVVLNTTPAWARAPIDKENPFAPPANPEDFARFAATFATRYRDVLRYYQIWHEPNIWPHWGDREADPLGYVRLLQLAAQAIRQADPDAVILSAALAPTLDPGRLNFNDLRYLEAMYRLGAGLWFDVLAYQGYGFDRPPEEPPSPSRLNFRRWELAREIMVRYGDAGKAIWLTGFGWNALPPERGSPWEEVPPQAQAEYLTRSVRYVQAHAPYVGPMFWVHAFPDLPAAAPEWGFALWDLEGSPRPAWGALAALAKEAALPAGRHPFPLPCPVTGQECRDPADPETRPLLLGPEGSEVDIPFEGTSVWLEAQGGPHWHTLWVEVDGRPAPELPKDAGGEAYLNLYRPRAAAVRVPVARGLPPGQHRLTVRSGPGDPVWPLTAVTVATEALLPFRLAAWGFILLGLGLLILGWRQLPEATSITVPRVTVGAWSMALVAATLPFTTRLIYWGSSTYVLPELALLLAVGVAAGRLVRGWRQRPWPTVTVRLPGRMSVILGALVLAALGVSTGVAANPAASLSAIKSRLLFPVLLYLLVRAAGDRERGGAVRGLVAASAALAVYALGDFISRADIWSEGVPRVRAFFGSPNHLALVLVRVLPFGLVLLARERRPLHAAGVGLIFLALTATLSRSVWLLGIPATVWLLARDHKLTQPVQRLAAAAAITGPVLLVVRNTDSWGQRLLIWAGTLRLVADHLWTGVGLGQFPWAYPQYTLPAAWREPLLYHPHNVLLATAAALGLPAAGALAWWLLSRVTSPPQNPWATAARASLVGGLACGLVDAFWALDDLSYLTAFALALLDARPAEHSRPFKPSASSLRYGC